MSKTKENKEKFFNKPTTILTVVCVIVITVVGTLLLKMETKDVSTVIKHENSSVLEAEIDKIVDEQNSSTDGYTPEVHGLININTADKETLMVLDGIGEKRAEAIIEYRVSHPFGSTKDIMNVSGIGEKIYEKIKDKICVK